MRDAGSINDNDFRCWWCWWWNHKVTLRALQWLHGWIKVSPVLVFIKWKTCNCWRKLIIVRCFPSFLASGPSNEHVNLCTLGHWRSGWCQDTEAAYLIYDQSSLVIAVLLEYQILYVDVWGLAGFWPSRAEAYPTVTLAHTISRRKHTTVF